MVSFSAAIFFSEIKRGEKIVEEAEIDLRGQLAFEFLLQGPGLQGVLTVKLLEKFHAEPLEIPGHAGMDIPLPFRVVRENPAAGSQTGDHRFESRKGGDWSA